MAPRTALRFFVAAVILALAARTSTAVAAEEPSAPTGKLYCQVTDARSSFSGLAYAVERDDISRIFVVPVEGGTARAISPADKHCFMPAWSR
ncbi:MAG TPA: hypothetical protein VHD36_07335 [Pirellulales bacterium]|nr:hypothetical protein [Pirellulales bacterium]